MSTHSADTKPHDIYATIISDSPSSGDTLQHLYPTFCRLAVSTPFTAAQAPSQ